jgi:aminopeptidase-like protein
LTDGSALAAADGKAIGHEMYELIRELYPICRSITGNGVRRTFDILEAHIPLSRTEVPTGTRVFDWTVPDEWNIRDAWIADARGTRVVDFRRCNLHVVQYSEPVRATLPLSALRERLHSLPERPEWIPYRTSYYSRTWGFCVAHSLLSELAAGYYEVVIDSTLEPGHLTYAEHFVQGATDDEVLISSYICHPSLANDNLSGVALAAMLAKKLVGKSHRYSYRFLFSPATIGPLTWLALNFDTLQRVKHGLVLFCVGDAGEITYKRSRHGTAEIDRAVEAVLRDSNVEHRLLDFVPWGGDERQFCSPGFDLPVGSLMRSPHGEFPEYHTSADNLSFVRPEALAESFEKCWLVFGLLESNRTYVNLSPYGEPQLGRRGLYRSLGGSPSTHADELALLWVLNMSDGRHSLLDIATRSGLRYAAVRRAADRLHEHGLVAEAGSSDRKEGIEEAEAP